MLDTLERTVEAPSETYEFTGNDRCDADGGFVRGDGRGVEVAEQAYHRWTKGDKELLLCDHHNRDHEEALFVGGWNHENSPLANSLGEPRDINHVG